VFCVCTSCCILVGSASSRIWDDTRDASWRTPFVENIESTIWELEDLVARFSCLALSPHVFLKTAPSGDSTLHCCLDSVQILFLHSSALSPACGTRLSNAVFTKRVKPLYWRWPDGMYSQEPKI
jgi:hypothetical protein